MSNALGLEKACLPVVIRRTSLPVIWVDESSVIPESVKGSVLSIGKFDGVHLGHRKLAQAACRLAATNHTKAVAVTFEPPPLAVLRPDLVRGLPLTPLVRKVQLLKQCGIDEVLVFRTGAWLLDLEAQAFFDEIVRRRLGAIGLVEGPDFSFGKDRLGKTLHLKSWSLSAGIWFEEVPPVERDGVWITSSAIRKQLESGNLSVANQWMGHPLATSGRGVPGAGRGRSIGVPTANLEELDTQLPAPGVYAAAARVVSSQEESLEWFAAAVNVGEQPTFGGLVPRVEAHLVGFRDRDLYGERVELVWLKRVRETLRFGSVEELKARIRRDLEESVKVFESEPLWG